MNNLYGDMNTSPFDAWSFVHVGGGVIAASLNTTLPTFLLIHTIWEILEQTEEVSSAMRKVGFDRDRMDSRTNMFGDTVAALIGWALGNAQNKKR